MKLFDKKLLKYTWPIFIELVLQLLVANIDKIMVNQVSNTGASAIANASSIMDLLIIAFTVISLSVTILCSQLFGKGKTDKIEQLYALGIIVNGAFGFIISIVLLLFGRNIFTLMKIPNDCMSEALIYLNICSLGLAFQGIFSTYSAMFRSNGWMKQSMLASTIMNGLNIVGNYFLIPHLGVAGAAISSVLSRIIGLTFLIIIFNFLSSIKVNFKCLNPWPSTLLKTMLKIGLPSGGETVSYNASQMVILTMVNMLGNSIVKVRTFAYMYAMIGYLLGCALSQASQVIIGYMIGEGNKDLAYQEAKKATILSVILNGTTALLIFLFAEPLFSLFIDEELLHIAKGVMFVDFILEIGRAINMTMVRSLQAVGDIKFPVICGILSMWFISIPIAYYFGFVQGLGLMGIWIGMASDECLRGLIFIIRWESGKWRKKDLINNL